MKTENKHFKFPLNNYIHLEKDELNWDWNFGKKKIYTKLISVIVVMVGTIVLFFYL